MQHLSVSMLTALGLSTWLAGASYASEMPIAHAHLTESRPPDSGPIACSKTQLLTVISDTWTDPRGVLQRYERAAGQPWRVLGSPQPVTLGYAGYGWGAGLHGRGAPAGRSGPVKHEGDGRSPAGVFELGVAHGYAGASVEALNIPYQMSSAADRCIDDPASQHYNQVVSMTRIVSDWRSSERMYRDDDRYELAIEVEHNRAPTEAGGGSCIFLHVWGGPNVPVTGCTALDKTQLRIIARWLKPHAVVLVALPRAEYTALQTRWGLP